MLVNLLKKTAFITLLAALVSSCTRSSVIYGPTHGPFMDVVMDRSKDANPIILIPGLGGTKLVDASNGKTAWGSYGHSSYWPSTEKDNQLLALPLTNRQAVVKRKQNKVKAVSVVETLKISLLPFSSFNLAIYATIMKSLKKAGYQPNPHDKPIPNNDSGMATPVFEFAYDWRQSNADSAIQLNNFIDAKSKYYESNNRSKKGQKFDIICHSMGCLVARYYLRYGDQGLGTSESTPELDWRGGDQIENIIMVAPPNKGSIEALSNLLNGYEFNHIKWLKYPAAVLGTMPSMYELLPRPDISLAVDQTGQDIDLMDPKLWQSMNWGILNPNQANILAQIAPSGSTNQEANSLALEIQETLLRKAKLFHSRLDQKSKSPEHLRFYLFAGVGTPTESNVRVNQNEKSISFLNAKSGDGKVLRASAYAIEDAMMPDMGPIVEWNNATFFLSNHLNLVKNNDFFVNLYDILMWRELL